MVPTVPQQRIVAGTPAVLSWQPTDSDGEPADPGTVTVEVVRSDGTVVYPAGTATIGTGNEQRTVALTPAQTEQLDWLTHTWTNADGVVVGVETAEVAGRPMCSWAQFQARESSVSGMDVERFIELRRAVEWKFTVACQRSFTPRFYVQRTHTIPGKGVLMTFPDVRALRYVRRFDGVDGTTYTDLTASEVAALHVDSDGRISYGAHGPRATSFTTMSRLGAGRIEIGYEHGYDAPPEDLRNAVMAAIRVEYELPKNILTDYASSVASVDGQVYQLPTPGLGEWVTGVPAIDEAVNRHKYRHWREQ